MAEEFHNIINDLDVTSLKMSVILITGANGMLAKYLVHFLMFLNQEYNYNIKVIALFRKNNYDKSLKNYLQNNFFKIIIQDVCEPLNIEGKIDYIIQAAGSANPKAIVNDPVGIIRANTIGNFSILELAKEKKVKKVLYLSTREIYGQVSEKISNISENDIGALDPMDNRSCYPEGKRAGEAIFNAYFNQHGIPFSIVRIAHAYGYGMAIDGDGRIMADIIGGVVKDNVIKLNSDGSAQRAFCYISDAVSAILFVLIKGNIGEAYNIANEIESYPIKYVAEILIKIFKDKNIKLILNASEQHCNALGYSKVTRVALNTDKIEKLGWKPRVDLKNGLKRTVVSFMYQ
jgi:nucleoside-diphosphate-sugar epimerase